ncbi:MAG TPA: hypothetical protein DC058_24405 [Planctomycetaceae bacterium]|nr:hypothetical protein [Planctomycetaceae bacterium]HBC64343.1 hypothetical protein [Planctomycetaceae bacterium]
MRSRVIKARFRDLTVWRGLKRLFRRQEWICKVPAAEFGAAGVCFRTAEYSALAPRKTSDSVRFFWTSAGVCG